MSHAVRVFGRYRLRLTNARGERRTTRWFPNTLCNAGLNQVAAWLNNEAPALTPVYGAVGTGSGTIRSTDTTLFSEFARITGGVSSRSTSIVTYEFFFTTSMANGTLSEAGVFLAATSSAGSGQLLSHAAISEVKTSGETLTLEFVLTVG